ncbi:hypothetical protein OWV82_022792 [Melia azedarach]|uniref:Uncharacterized protein n=1 Tax=Melia azedarach TaxID=155640 RepID=A0ACC1WWH2_MELAZ|nr:hypothetical protein OWV82_022792 [Melia azedarach]
MASHQPRAGAMNFIFLLISLILLTAFVLEAESRPVQVNHLNVNDVKENKQVNDRKIFFPPTPFPQIPQLPFPPPPPNPQIPQLPFPPPRT